jgi:hypothetical protein
VPSTQALIDHWSHLHRELSALRKLLVSDEVARANFDEYLDVNEFELALHTLCDHLLDSTALFATDLEITAIDKLHQEMRLVDKCVANLRRQAEFNIPNSFTTPDK